MDKTSRDLILKILDGTPDVTIATNRSDGYPQATTVSFIHDGLKLYFGCSPQSQKALNIARDKRVSATVNLAYRDWSEIKGLSLAGDATVLSDPAEIGRVAQLFTTRFGAQMKDLPPLSEAEFAFVRLDPKLISILDYSKGFGHTDLVRVEPGALA